MVGCAPVRLQIDRKELSLLATIGIDATALSTPASGGIGTAQYRTLRALAELDTPHRFVLYAARPPVVPFSGRPLDLPWPVRLGSGPLTRSNILWMQTGVNRLLRQDRVDVFWGPRHLLPFLAAGVAKVATVHDFWDRYFPSQQPWPNRALNRLLIGQVIARADVVVAPSQSTARDAVRFCHADEDRLCIVPWGVDAGLFRRAAPARIEATLAKHRIREPFILSLDVFNPRKNVALVLAAATRLPADLRSRLTIVAVGRRRATATAVDLRRRAAELGLLDHLVVLDDLALEELVALYSAALALVYPSLYEGFGMPLLEAMASGCPVITADRSPLPEVAGDAALLVNPTDAAELAQAIVRIATDGEAREKLIDAGSVRAQGFTWQHTAEGMLDAFARAWRRREGRCGLPAPLRGQRRPARPGSANP